MRSCYASGTADSRTDHRGRAGRRHAGGRDHARRQPDLVGSSEVCVGIPLFAQVSADQEATDILECMVIKKNLVSLLSLLESKAGIASSKPLAPTRPLTPVPPSSINDQASLSESVEKKRKMEKKHGKGVLVEGKGASDYSLVAKEEHP